MWYLHDSLAIYLGAYPLPPGRKFWPENIMSARAPYGGTLLSQIYFGETLKYHDGDVYFLLLLKVLLFQKQNVRTSYSTTQIKKKEGSFHMEP